MSQTWSDAFSTALRGLRTHHFATLGVLLAAVAALYWGWQLHWFLTDDAFIAFRFIDNRQQGYGYTWNPPPFLPVEGYTSFAWVVLLDAIWSVFGMEPPDAANNLSLALSIGTLVATCWGSQQLCLRHGVSPAAAVGVAAAVLLATVTQRTFLIWASGGLETALFNLLLQSWILTGLLCTAREGATARFLAVWFTLASALALTRPEGLLAVGASAAAGLACVVLRVIDVRKALACASPLACVAAHLVFRRAYYGEWLPNTYYAKVVTAWPSAGLRYGAAFGLEYAYYLAAPVWACGAWVWVRRSWGAIRAADGGEARRRLAAFAMQGLALGVLFATLGFVMLVAGGDHFEYRVLSFLCPLCPLAFVYGSLALRPSARLATVGLVVFSAISAILPWTAFASQNDDYVWPTKPPVKELADVAPAPLRPIAAQFDALERWLIPHGVGIRHYEHRAFWLHQLLVYPPRTFGAAACAQADHPVAVLSTIGVSGWVLSGCAIIDRLGLTDYYIARTPGKLGYLGHDRKPPIDYLRAFRPNVVAHSGRVVIHPRLNPLTDDEIRAIEAHYRALVVR